MEMPDHQQIIPVLYVWSADGIFPGPITENGFFDGKICLCFCFFLCNFAKYKEIYEGEGVADVISGSLWCFSFYNLLVIRDFEDEFVRESMIEEFV